MSYITEFTIEGLVGRKEPYYQKLNRDINIFFGLNGSGKTSLLRILDSAMGNNVDMLESIPFHSAEVKIYSESYKKVYTHKFTKAKKKQIIHNDEIFYSVDEDHVGFEDVSLADARRLRRFMHDKQEIAWKCTPKEPGNSRWAHRYLPTSRLWTTLASDSRKFSSTSLSEEQLDRGFEKTLENLWIRYISEILGKVGEAQAGGLANILEGIISTDSPLSKSGDLDVERAYKRADSFLKRQGAHKALGSLETFRNRYATSQIFKSVVGSIDEVERKIESSMNPRDNLQALITKLFTGNKKVALTDKGIKIKAEDDSPIRLASLSSGEKHIMRILIECLYAEGSSLLIDEPELSMHIDWQKDLISSMQSINKNAQYILATHSPEIMADVDDSKIFRL